MERRAINPWTWQDQYGFVQANEIRRAQRTLVVSGQTSFDGNGHIAFAGDMAGQLSVALDNLETVLEQANMLFSNLVRLNFFTVDMDGFLAVAGGILGQRLAGVEYATSCIGVSQLAFSELLVEIEATAVD